MISSKELVVNIVEQARRMIGCYCTHTFAYFLHESLFLNNCLIKAVREDRALHLKQQRKKNLNKGRGAVKAL